MLKAKSPKVKEKRLKLFVYGEPGVGKTLGAIQFPYSYIIDTEKGTDFYHETIEKQKSVVLQTNNVDDVREELKALLTEKHIYKTLIIDPITPLYLQCQEKWTRIFEGYAKTQKEKDVQDFGMRYWSKVKSDFKAIQRLILALDMNVIITAHQKDVYDSQFNKIGVTFDSMKGDNYLFDLIFRLANNNGKREAVTIKERADIGKQKFPEIFEWSYKNFTKYYGKEIIEKEAIPQKMATGEQIMRLYNLIEIVKVDDDIVQKWLNKAGVDSIEEFTEEQILKSIKYLEDKLNSIKKEGK